MARKAPGTINIGSSGRKATIPHLAIELLQQQAASRLRPQVPYRGGGQALQDVVSGQILADVHAARSTIVSYVQSESALRRAQPSRRASASRSWPTCRPSPGRASPIFA